MECSEEVKLYHRTAYNTSKNDFKAFYDTIVVKAIKINLKRFYKGKMEINKTTEILRAMEKIKNCTKAGALNYVLDIGDNSALMGYYSITDGYDEVCIMKALSDLKEKIRCDYKHMIISQDTVMVQLEVAA